MMIMIVGGIHDDGSGAVRGWKSETRAKLDPKNDPKKSKIAFLFCLFMMALVAIRAEGSNDGFVAAGMSSTGYSPTMQQQ